jgi:hypothetical protein
MPKREDMNSVSIVGRRTAKWRVHHFCRPVAASRDGPGRRDRANGTALAAAAFRQVTKPKKCTFACQSKVSWRRANTTKFVLR